MGNKGVLPVVIVFWVLWGTVAAMAIWHIPSHTAAKHTATETK